MGFVKKLFLIFLVCRAAVIHAQTPDLQAVTNAGNSTNNSMVIWNKDGLSIGMDSTTGYTVKSHFLRPSSVETRTLRFDCDAETNTGGWEFYNTYSRRSVLFINQGTGNVGIGTTNPQAKLSVNGDISARLVRVRPEGWADFVFEPSYHLMPLAELEAYIRNHKHLPSVPSEKEVIEHGLDLGNNQVVLLQKVEELTLYLIEQEHKMTAQKALLQEQSVVFAQQEERLAELERRMNVK
ncbi:hypothetical protein [Chitinophaga rhizophila]|uniref:Uncharacterized protein n=1 Tax=Chitinophaga rhizophila TaxID=2866212 RepID=A0ABS7G819_9BACT|nr:hypothetical protein [Chitinophaga rhizophila]MBW8682708.1 hypothetical protein [Chitinophaga rhizophila]